MHLHIPTQRDPERRHFQRARHHRADSAGAARRQVPADRRGGDPAAQPAHLRRRRHHRPVHRHQAHRRHRHRPPPRLTHENSAHSNSRPRILLTAGRSPCSSAASIPLVVWAGAQALFPAQGQRQPARRQGRHRARLDAARPEFHRATNIFSRGPRPRARATTPRAPAAPTSARRPRS